MPDLLANLNPQQLAAVTLPHESALILAGAGSGKTRVLTTRIAWLIQTGQASPHGLLAVTFTNKAAREMLTRISRDAADQHPRHVGRHVPWPVQPHAACPSPRSRAAADCSRSWTRRTSSPLIKRLLKTLNVDERSFLRAELQ